MGHRHYDSRVGRFISRDPIGFEGGLHLFNGAGTSPVTYVDPSGLLWREAATQCGKQAAKTGAGQALRSGAGATLINPVTGLAVVTAGTATGAGWMYYEMTKVWSAQATADQTAARLAEGMAARAARRQGGGEVAKISLTSGSFS